MSNYTPNGRIRLPLLSADAFTCETDKIALENLEKTPLLPQIVRKFNEIAGDRILYATNSADSVRCSDGQFETLYKLLVEASDVLDIPLPELYVRFSANMNAYSGGVSQSFVVLKSSLINTFTDEELLFVIGHELGHIKCGHILYQMVGRILIPLIEAIGSATFGLGSVAGIGLVSAFYEWIRQAEFSCDRAGLLACQNPRVALSAIMKLGSGGTRLDSEMNLDLFLEQARQHADATGAEGFSKILTFFMYNWQRSHPQVVYRAHQLDKWVASGEYEKILSGNYQQTYAEDSDDVVGTVCTWCGFTLPPNTNYCPKCGTKV